MKKGKFPKRPELLSDVPERQKDFEPGRDAVFEKVIELEREEAEAEEDSGEDSDSLTAIEFGLREEDSSSEEEDEDEEINDTVDDIDTTEDVMPPRQQAKLPVMKGPFKMAGQDDVSFALLRPKIGYMKVPDPSYKRRNGSMTRTCLVVRVDIPSGVVRQSFIPDISMDGKRLNFSCYYDQSRHHAKFTCGSIGTDRIVMAMDEALSKSWSHIHNSCQVANKGGETREYLSVSIVLPEPVEREFHDFTNNWEECAVGTKGAILEFPKAEGSRFYYSFLFTVNSKEKTPAMAAVNNLLLMDISFADNPMTAQNLARNDYINHRKFDNVRSPRSKRSPTKRKKNKKKSSVNLAEDLNNMSISFHHEDDDDGDSSIESKVVSERRRNAKRSATPLTEEQIINRLAARMKRSDEESLSNGDVPKNIKIGGRSIEEMRQKYGEQWWLFNEEKESNPKADFNRQEYDPRIVLSDSDNESFSSAKTSDVSRSRRTRRSSRRTPPKTAT